MKFIQYSAFLILSIFVSTYVLANEDKEEAPVEVRLLGAKKVLLEQANIALVYVKGLVCPSCAIGVRKNLSKMKGVDKSRFRDGIDMNPDTQLVAIAFNEKGFVLNDKEVIERVEDAGYIAVEKYQLHDGHLDALRYKHDASVEVVHHEHH